MGIGCPARGPRKGWEGPAACGGVRGPGAILRAEPSTAPPDDPTPCRGAQRALEDGDTPKKLYTNMYAKESDKVVSVRHFQNANGIHGASSKTQ